MPIFGKKEDRQKRRKERKQLRQERRAERIAQRKEEGSKFERFFAEKLEKVIEAEVTKIRMERGEIPASGINESQQLVNKLLEEAQKGIANASIPIVSKLAAVIPDILDGFKTQIRSAYDISVKSGYRGEITTELMLFVLVDAFSKKHTGTDLGIITQDKVLIKKDSNGQFLKVVALKLGNVMVGRLLKSVVAKWVPVLGPVVAALWNNQAEQSIASSAKDVFASGKPVVFTDDLDSHLSPAEMHAKRSMDETFGTSEPTEDEYMDIERMHTLLQLMFIDKDINPAERTLFLTMLNNSDIDEEERQDIIQMLDEGDQEAVDFSHFMGKPEESWSLVVDLVAMARADRRLVQKEERFILAVACNMLKLPREQVLKVVNTSVKKTV